MHVPMLQAWLTPISTLFQGRSTCPVCHKRAGSEDYRLHGELFHYECAAFRLPGQSA